MSTLAFYPFASLSSKLYVLLDIGVVESEVEAVFTSHLNDLLKDALFMRAVVGLEFSTASYSFR